MRPQAEPVTIRPRSRHQWLLSGFSRVGFTPRPIRRRTKGETCGILSRVDDRPLTEEELQQLRQNLARLSESGVENVYREAYVACELKGTRLPKPVAIQQLVQAWRQLW